MATPTLSEWLKDRGIDESTLAGDRAAQLRSFWLQDCERAKEIEATVAKDSKGTRIQRGDTVTITYTVSAVHNSDNGPTVCLDRDGEHSISILAEHVTKES